ncbi:3497_t:CDS:2, partial [Funneliformis geosporum]
SLAGYFSEGSVSSLLQYLETNSDIRYDGALLMPFYLGLTTKENVEWLHGYVSETYSNLFEEIRELYKVELARDKLFKTAKRKAEEISNEMESITANISGNSFATKVVTKQLLKYYKTDEIEFDEESQMANNNLVQKLIQKGKLGSTIFINTTEYLSLVVAQPCSTCNNFKVSTTCKQCHTITIFTNESTKMNFLRVVAGAGLLGGVNHIMLKDIVQVAHQSADEALTAALNFIKKQLKKKEEYILEGKGSVHRSIIAFHVAEKSRVYK